MKQLKANNYQKALKEFKKLDDNLANELSENINDCDRKMYHIALIKIEDQPGQAKNKVTSNVSKLHKHSFERLQKNSKFLGIAKMIVVHDPSLLKEDDKPAVPAHLKESVANRVKRELKAKHEAEIAEETAKAIAEATKPEEVENNEGDQGGQEDTRTPEQIEEDRINAETEMKEVYETIMETGKKADFLAFGVDYKIEGVEDAKDNDARQLIIKTWFEKK